MPTEQIEHLSKFVTFLNPETDEDREQLREAARKLFTYQPWGSEQIDKGAAVKDALEAAYIAVVENVKAGPLRTRALNMLTDCRMLANQAITFPGQ